MEKGYRLTGKAGHHTNIAFKNDYNLNIGDECYVRINSSIFGVSYVEEKSESKDLIGINLPNEAEEYIAQLEQANIPINFHLILKS